MPTRLLVLTLTAFVLGTAEYVVTGLLPEVAGDLGVSIPVAGALITGYAFAIVVGGPLVVLGGTRVPRKALLTGAVALFVLGSLLCAVAAGYAMLMVGRVLAALGQAAFLGVGSVVVANLVSPDQRARAISVVFAGITVANVVGSPLGTLVGQHLGWRSTFWLIAALALVSLVGIGVLIPRQPTLRQASMAGELAVFGRGQVWLTLAVATLGMGALFSSYSYVAPLLTNVSGLPRSAIPWMLGLVGVGLFVGNLVGGWGADRNRFRTSLAALVLLFAGLLVLALFARYPVVAGAALFVAGAAGFAIVPVFLARLIGLTGGKSPLAATMGGSAANLGTALGASLGAVTIGAGLGYTSPAWIGASAAVLGLALTILAEVVDARTARSARVCE